MHAKRHPIRMRLPGRLRRRRRCSPALRVRMIGDSGPYASRRHEGARAGRRPRLAGRTTCPPSTWRPSPPAPTTRCAAPSAASAPTRPSSPWRACSTGWPRRSASAAGRSAPATSSRPASSGAPARSWTTAAAAPASCLDAVKPALRRGPRRGQGRRPRPRAQELGPRQRLPRDLHGRSCASRTTAPSRCATAGPRWARACTPSPSQVAVEELGIDPDRVRVVVDTTRELGAGQTTGSRGTLMGSGSVADACQAALADGCRTGVDYAGEFRVDWTNHLGEPGVEHPIIHSAFGYAAQVVIVDRETGRRREGGRRPRRRPGREPAAVRRPDRGRRAHGPRLRAHRGLPDRRRRPAHRHDPAVAQHHPGQGRARRSRSSSSRCPSPTPPTASRAWARSAWCPPPARWPPRSTSSTASGATPCRCDPTRGSPAVTAAVTADERTIASVVVELPPSVTPGLVCGHHHLYSALARGMPAPPRHADRTSPRSSTRSGGASTPPSTSR